MFVIVDTPVVVRPSTHCNLTALRVDRVTDQSPMQEEAIYCPDQSPTELITTSMTKARCTREREGERETHTYRERETETERKIKVVLLAV